MKVFLDLLTEGDKVKVFLDLLTEGDKVKVFLDLLTEGDKDVSQIRQLNCFVRERKTNGDTITVKLCLW